MTDYRRRSSETRRLLVGRLAERARLIVSGAVIVPEVAS